MKKNYIFLTLFFILLILITGFIKISPEIFKRSPLKTLQINTAKILVETVQTPEARNKGLSGRINLPQNQGMLFLFEQPSFYAFWMKEMNFPLDFIWINDGHVVQVNQNVKPEDYQPPKSLSANQPVDAVLEINAGMAHKLNIKIGDEVNY